MTEMMFDWRRVAEREPKGHLELQTEKMVIHGPVESLKVNEDDMVVITLKWAARSAPLDKPGFGKWKNSPEDREVIFPNVVVPYVIESTPEKGERVRFGLSMLYFDAVEGLDPARVQGLELDETGRMAAGAPAPPSRKRPQPKPRARKRAKK